MIARGSQRAVKNRALAESALRASDAPSELSRCKCSFVGAWWCGQGDRALEREKWLQA